MKRERTIQCVVGVLGAVFFGASSLVAVRLGASVSQNRLEYAIEANKAQPPEVAIGIAMGAFRGVFVNLLWMRANDLKEEGKFWEAVDLAETITTLQPRFPSVWTFHAWNMAYNISVATKTPEERWYWVSAGINLLRNGGAVHNPSNLLIHKELGWIFLHKIGGFMDDANVYYKVQHAIEWTEVMGEPPRLSFTEDRDAAIENYVAWLEPIARAPKSLEAMYTLDPATRDLLAAVKEQTSMEPGVELTRQFWFHRAIARSGQHAAIYAQMPPGQRALFGIINNEALAPAWDAAMPTLRFMALRDEYNMEIDRMVRYTRQFGPLDWRTPSAHGVYWVERGVEGALNQFQDRNEKDYDFLNTDRVKTHAIQELARSGDLYFDYLTAALHPDERVFYLANVNPYFFASYEKTIAQVQQRAGITEDTTKRIWTFHEAGFENFANDCIRFYYRRGQIARAQEIKDKMGSWLQQNANDPRRPARYALPLDEFVVKEMHDRLMSPQVLSAEAYASLQGAFLGGLSTGNDKVFQDQINYARMIHKLYFSENATQNDLGSNTIRQEIYMPRDFGMMEGIMFGRTLGMVDPDTAQDMYANAPDRLKKMAYDTVVQVYGALYAQNAPQTGVTLAIAFPEPAGMDQFRIEFERRRRALDAANVSIQQR